ncbi:MAG: PD40 domain-containing protein [Candidatus Latescibacterota bacterium]|nr:MAG: PD40 domain-containing protein [Candidatus Latescibacterota bacterium]
MRLRGRIISVLVLLTVLASAAAIPTQAQFGRNKIQYKNLDWQVLTTPHFEFHFHQGSEAFVIRAALIMEDGYRMLSEKVQETLPWRVPVILYGAHNDFLQTNVAQQLLPEGVQAFAEPSRKRIVLPFTGSYKAFAHTAIHELAHVFTFQIVYNRLLDNVFSRNYLFPMPLWIAEGVAEYLAVGWDEESDMFIRDAVIHDYLVDLDYAGGFMVYKEGQSALNFIEDTYGQEKVRELLFALGSTRSADIALERTLGLDTREFSARWKKSLRKHYWPMYGEKTEAEDIGRRLTDHKKNRAYYNTKAVMSPDGEKIAYFSDRDGLISIYIMSTIDGKVIKKLVSGYRSNRFESLHFFTSSISFSPDGAYLTFVAKSKGRDVLYIVDSNRGKVKKKIKVECNEMTSPTWSPDGASICVSANFGGQTDLILVDVESGEMERLTNDPADQLSPRFFPDGKRVVFTYYPELTIPVPSTMNAEAKRTLSEMDFLAYENVRRGLSFDIYEIEIDSRVMRPLIQTAGDDADAVVLDDGKRMIFTSDVSGISNLYIADLEKGTHYRITDALSGLFTPDVVESKNRLTFTAFIDGGYDIFISDDLESLIRNRYADESVVAGIQAQEGATGAGTSLAVEGSVGPDIPLVAMFERTALAKPETPESEETGPGADVYSVTEEDSASVFNVAARIPGVSDDKDEETEGTSLAQRAVSELEADVKTGARKTKGLEGIHRPVTDGEPETKGGTVSKYKLKLAPDFIGGGGVYFATGYGFGLANTIALSDILGNHRMVFSFNLQRDIADSDILASYYYLKKRINYGFGVFQFKNFLNSRVSSIGESFRDYTLFAERNYGMFGLVSIPFNTFDRLDFELQAFISERQFFEAVAEDPLTNQLIFEESGRSTRRLVEPTMSFIHDASFYSLFGPVEGSRWMVSLSRGIGFDETGVSRSTGYIDYRKYKRVFYRNSLAFRGAFAASEGKDPRTFFLGGPTTLRGYDFLSFEGSRMAFMNVEYRFPLIDALIVGWPGRWGIGNIGGKVFFDAGAVWDKGDIKPFRDDVNGLQFKDALGDLGLGLHFYIGYFLLNFQWAWQTDLREFYASHFTFFIGPGF